MKIYPFFIDKKWRDYSAQVDFSFKTGHFQVKIAQSLDELKEVFRLRYKVFVKEWGNKRFSLPLLETDQYDWDYDHLIIISRKDKKRIVATCRLKLVQDCEACYTSKYYSLFSFFEAFSGPKVEMGRLCVDPRFRQLSVLLLVWRGLAKYLSHTHADYLFGVSSIPSSPEMAMEKARNVYGYFREKNYLDSFLDLPFKDYNSDFNHQMERQKKWPEEEREKKIRGCMPSLLQFYLGQGAKICSKPSWDGHFNCIDFLTVLDKKCLPENQLKKYFC